MKSISEREYMLHPARVSLARAQEMVDSLPEDVDPEGIRCHELARAVALYLPIDANAIPLDGTYAHVDHSWIYLSFGAEGYILDVYCVGRLHKCSSYSSMHCCEIRPFSTRRANEGRTSEMGFSPRCSVTSTSTTRATDERRCACSSRSCLGNCGHLRDPVPARPLNQRRLP